MFYEQLSLFLQKWFIPWSESRMGAETIRKVVAVLCGKFWFRAEEDIEGTAKRGGVGEVGGVYVTLKLNKGIFIAFPYPWIEEDTNWHMSSAAPALFFLCMLLDRVLLNPTARCVGEAKLCEWMISRTRDAVTILCIVMLERTATVRAHSQIWFNVTRLAGMETLKGMLNGFEKCSVCSRVVGWFHSPPVGLSLSSRFQIWMQQRMYIRRLVFLVLSPTYTPPACLHAFAAAGYYWLKVWSGERLYRQFTVVAPIIAFVQRT